MNKKIFINLIFSGVIFLFGIFAFAIPAQAGVVQFGSKQIFADFDGLPFDLNNWAPGMSDQKTIRIDNNEGFDIDVYLKAEKTPPGDDVLADALTITAANQPKHLADLFNNNIALGSVASGNFQNYDIALAFDKTAGNECQGKTINWDFVLTAAEVGGGNGDDGNGGDGGTGGSGGGGGTSVTIPGGGYVIPEIPMTDNGQVVATPGEGGITTLVNPDGGGIKLVIPSGAVEADTLFVVTMVGVNSLTLPPEGSGLFVIDGFAYQITATRNGQPVTTFPKPLVFSINYTDEQIAGFDEASLRLQTFQNGVWVPIEGRIDGENNIITSFIYHLSLYALLGAPEGIDPAVKGESTIIPSGEVTRPSASQPGGEAYPSGEDIVPGGETVVPGPTDSQLEMINNDQSSASQGFSELLASLGVAWRGAKTVIFSLWGVILAIFLILIGIKIWRKRKRIRR